MKKVMVTGCAGFIGSTLCQRLLQEGYQVIGIDCINDQYDSWIKQSNLKELINHQSFLLIKRNILEIDWHEILSDVEYVFHQAAIPGVRTSWGGNFEVYVQNNVLATQVILEAIKESGIKKFIYASSSSVYGHTQGKMSESRNPKPISPYGVTKLAGEQLCHLYAENYGVPSISLRYFTVYGPKQRPDMAFHKFCRALLKNDWIEVYGDGNQTRDFTYVDDIVEANLLAMKTKATGMAMNIGGKSQVSLIDVIHQIGSLMKREPRIKYVDKQAGDPLHTWADIQLAEAHIGYSPKVPLKEGLQKEIDDIRELYLSSPPNF